MRRRTKVWICWWWEFLISCMSGCDWPALNPPLLQLRVIHQPEICAVGHILPWLVCFISSSLHVPPFPVFRSLFWFWVLYSVSFLTICSLQFSSSFLHSAAGSWSRFMCLSAQPQLVVEIPNRRPQIRRNIQISFRHMDTCKHAANSYSIIVHLFIKT